MKLLALNEGERARIACSPEELDRVIAFVQWLFAGRCKVKAFVQGRVAVVIAM